MNYNGYRYLQEINCGFLLGNGVFYPCDYTKHSNLLNYLFLNDPKLDKSKIIKFNKVGGFSWVDFSSPLKCLTNEQLLFVQTHKDLFDLELYEELLRYH